MYRAPNKVPIKKTNHPRCHWTRKKGSWKPKRSFSSFEEAEAYIKKHRIVKYKAYRCKVCGAIHIGYEHD